MSKGIEPVASGVPFPVSSVRGAAPATLEDFAGEVVFVVQAGRPVTVFGAGAAREDHVRVSQKMPELDGKDLRVWLVSMPAPGQFVAQAASSA